MNFKAELLRSKDVKPTMDGTGYVEDYTQNCIEWVNFLPKTEIDAGYKNYHKCITIHEAISRLKDKFLRLHKGAVKPLYGEGKYKLPGDYSSFVIPYREWVTDKKITTLSKKMSRTMPLICSVKRHRNHYHTN